MFELVISDKKNNDINLDILAKRLEKELSKGVFAYDEYDNRQRVLLAAQDRMADYIRARAKEEVVEHLAVEYKYSYFVNNLDLPMLDEFLKSAFCSALAVFDKATDKRYISDNINFFNEVNIDSVFAFKLPLLKDRWDEIILLVKDNILELAQSAGLVEMMRFLLNQSPCESDEVVVDCVEGGLSIQNARGEEQFFIAEEDSMSKLVHYLVLLLPKRVVACNQKLNRLSEVFGDRVDFRSLYLKTLDKM